MSKFLCDCGQVIFDQADYIRYKGHIIADQDYMDFFDEIEKGDFMEMVEKGSKYFGRIFQCEYCSSLIVFRPGKNEGIFFKPIDKDKSKQILSSFLGESWLGVMSANFRNGQGEIFWTTNCDSGFRQNLSLIELKMIYQAKFQELSSLNILRHSFLNIEGKIEHKFEIQ